MNILVIPEDFRKDQYILKPLFERLLRSLGRRNARVRICQDPLLGGIVEATKSVRIVLRHSVVFAAGRTCAAARGVDVGSVGARAALAFETASASVAC